MQEVNFLDTRGVCLASTNNPVFLPRASEVVRMPGGRRYVVTRVEWTLEATRVVIDIWCAERP